MSEQAFNKKVFCHVQIIRTVHKIGSNERKGLEFENFVPIPKHVARKLRHGFLYKPCGQFLDIFDHLPLIRKFY